MKIYFIDKDGKYLDIKKKLEEIKNETIEVKESIKHRIIKTDLVITVDLKDEYEEYQKVNNLIILTLEKDKKIIWNMANKLKTKDIIDLSNNVDYIVKRIYSNIS